MNFEYIDKVKEIAKILNGLSRLDIKEVLKRVDYIVDCSPLSTEKVDNRVIDNISEYDFIY